jgi:hypothetical protein
VLAPGDPGVVGVVAGGGGAPLARDELHHGRLHLHPDNTVATTARGGEHGCEHDGRRACSREWCHVGGRRGCDHDGGRACSRELRKPRRARTSPRRDST